MPKHSARKHKLGHSNLNNILTEWNVGVGQEKKLESMNSNWIYFHSNVIKCELVQSNPAVLNFTQRLIKCWNELRNVKKNNIYKIVKCSCSRRKQ